MDSVYHGNAKQDSQGHKEWFIGYFMDDESLCKTEAVEVKWGEHEAGDSKDQPAYNEKATTMTILFSGEFLLSFCNEGKAEEVRLSKPGDYAVWMPGVKHSWQAVKNSVIFTVRWPSVKDDQVDI